MINRLFIMLVIIWPCLLQAQQSYIFQQVSLKDGLAFTKANCITQDEKGYYWVGTDVGMQRFDGKNFSKILSTGNKKGRHFSAPIHTLILSDSLGNVWGLSGNSITVYASSTGKTTYVYIKDDPENPKLSKIEYFCKDKYGAIWIITGSNLYQFDQKQQKPILWANLFEMSNQYRFNKMVFDKYGKSLWISNSQGIYAINLASKKIEKIFRIDKRGRSIKHDLPLNLLLDSKQNLWISDWAGNIWRYNIPSGQSTNYWVNTPTHQNKGFTGIPVTCFKEYKGLIWMGTYEAGLFFYNSSEDSIKKVPLNGQLENGGRMNGDIYDLQTDREGNLLVCASNGINVLPAAFNQFINIDVLSTVGLFPKTSVTKIFETTSGRILAGIWDHGLWVYDQNFKIIRKINSPHSKSVLTDERRKMAWCFAEDESGKIWIGFQYGLVGVLDTATWNIRYLEVPVFNQKTVRTITHDKTGNIWFGLHSGMLGQWNKTNHQFKVFEQTAALFKNSASGINEIIIDKYQKIWAATDANGFFCFDPQKEKITEHYPLLNEDNSKDYVSSFTGLNDSVFLITTGAHGVMLFNHRRKKFFTTPETEKYAINSIYGLASDDHQNNWLATTHGLYQLKKDAKEPVQFGEEDGLLISEFTSNIVKLKNGLMAIGSTSGFVYFNPDSIKMAPVSPPVQITGFSLFDHPLLIDSLLRRNKPIRLKHEQNFVTIYYASLSYNGKRSFQYYYRLQGVDKDWVTAYTKRQASYTNLQPGNYTFEVKCINRDGGSSALTSLHIEITPPWWKSWGAIGLYGLLIVSIIYSIYRTRLNAINKKQSDQLKAMVATQEEERKRISRDLHDDVGTKLSALKLFVSSLHDKAARINNEEIKSLAKSSEQFITEVMHDVRQLLLNLSPSVLEEFGYTTAVEGLVNKINETNAINFKLVVFGMNGRLRKEYELVLYRLTQELINNVLKHAEAKNVSLQIGQRDNKIILMIEDDGKGFDLNVHNGGYGLQNLYARTKLMHGSITIDSKPGNGTSVLIEIPFNLS